MLNEQSTWRDTILNDIMPNVSRIILVADPDYLLAEEKLALILLRHGLDLVEFTDSIQFRYVYESKYRSVGDDSELHGLLIVLRLENADLDSLPYDLLQVGRKISFSLGELFPNFSYSVIEQLDRSLFDVLFEAHSKSSQDHIGDNATMDFILRHVFGIDVELITNEVRLLQLLLRLHYGNVDGKLDIPPIIIKRLIQVLENFTEFDIWPLPKIIQYSEDFFAFLQERWPAFLSRLGDANQVREYPLEYGLRYSGPDYLPFDHQDIRVYIDNLFLEGKLTPVKASSIDANIGSWVRSGIVIANADTDEQRTSDLFELVKQKLPTIESRYSDWITFALKWADLSAKVHRGDNEQHQAHLREIGSTLNKVFANWLIDHYAGLINQSPANPVMLHHVPRRLARDMEISENGRVVLIVMDGLALDQWVTVRQFLQKRDTNLLIHESAIFAWIPTLTSVSRQAIFSGKPPFYFPSSIESTRNEEKLWRQFWEEEGISEQDIAYQRSMGNGRLISGMLDVITHSGEAKVVGLVVDKVDKIMHGMQLGAAGMHNQIEQWCSKYKFLSTLIDYMLNYEYTVWLTADHGNIECDGRGRPSEGAIAEIHGQRARVYSTREFREQIATSFPFSRKWEPIGLPENYFPLVADDRDAFVNPGEVIVSHGGTAIEEVLVPLVKFERRTL